MHHTKTGSFPIGFRQGSSHWQRDIDRLLAFAGQSGFSFVDLGPSSVDEVRRVLKTGLGIGSVDLMRWADMVNPDPARQNSAIAQNAEHIRLLAACGVKFVLAVVAPADPELARVRNFDLAVDAYGRLASEIASTGLHIVFEGAPGRPPRFPTIACTPADYRAFFADVATRFGAEASEVLGINFDPSHLIRMGIDPVRFVNEFAPRIHHMHGKDTMILTDGLYEHGHLQQATFERPHGFGAYCWRYAIPGRGDAPWPALFGVLRSRGYAGRVSIELEDELINGTEAGEKAGLIESRDYLAAC